MRLLALAFLGVTPALAQAPDGFNFGATTPLVAAYDRDKDGRLDAAERKVAREAIAAAAVALGARGSGVPGRGGPAAAPRSGGAKLVPADVRVVPETVPLYDPQTLRTVFIDFENKADWEAELESFNNTDVDVPARVTVDGRVYEDVGIHFRGLSSYMLVPATQKRSLNLSFDFVRKEQRLLGYSTLNLLNSHEDPSFLRTILFNTIAREYVPAAKANLVRVVINGESWGVYVNSQQFNKEWVKEWFQTTEGARWKAPGSPGGRANWGYLGDDVASYRGSYEIKSKDEPKDWAKLINVFKVLNQTPPDRLEAELGKILDLDGALRFLALDNALVNNDGYWIRASDYVIYKDTKDIVHILPQDVNETLLNNVELDPLISANDPNRQLAQNLLAVPALRARYLAYVRDIATKWLDWNRLGPVAQQYHDLILFDVRADVRKLYPSADFERSLTADTSITSLLGPTTVLGLKNFADRRRAYLLKVTAP